MINKISILIVDDDRELTSTLCEMLSKDDYDIDVANDGEEALALIQRKKFHVVVLDLKMPKRDGFEVLAFTKRSYPNTKIIVLTAYVDLINVSKCRELGADDVIQKPYELGDLFDAIEYVLKR